MEGNLQQLPRLPIDRAPGGSRRAAGSRRPSPARWIAYLDSPLLEHAHDRWRSPGHLPADAEAYKSTICHLVLLLLLADFAAARVLR